LTPETFCQNCGVFFHILAVLRLDLGQISLSLVENAFNFFSLSFFSFAFLFAAVIGLLPGLLGVKKCPRKSHRGGQFLPWSSCVVVGNLALSFSLIFFSIFVHISGPNKPITVN